MTVTISASAPKILRYSKSYTNFGLVMTPIQFSLYQKKGILQEIQVFEIQATVFTLVPQHFQRIIPSLFTVLQNGPHLLMFVPLTISQLSNSTKKW